MLSILFAASEVFPFAKTGGLADVAYSLPRALGERHEVTVVMPLYRMVDQIRYRIEKRDGMTIVMGGTSYNISMYGCHFEGIEYLFVGTPLFGEREYLYGPPERGYEDNALRFGLFSYAITHLAAMLRSDIVHLNDWQTALAALLISREKTVCAKTVYTIHNLAYQGIFEASFLKSLGIEQRYFTQEGIEFYGKINLMKSGIGYADAVTTVSPTYAKEILTPVFGCGLDGFLKVHANKLTGIINGIDTSHFSPSTDLALYRPYKTPQGKKFNKQRYLSSVNLQSEDKPLFIFIGRFTWQKGVDMLIETLLMMAGDACNIAILGEGEAHYRTDIESQAERCDNVHCFFGYDEALAHRMYAAADFLLMPSVFEPCGLNQLIAMHYGTIPVVHSVGGLADTVSAYDSCDTARGCGVVFDSASSHEFMQAFEAALDLYARPKTCLQIAAHDMQVDVSWHNSAKRYENLYRTLSEEQVECT